MSFQGNVAEQRKKTALELNDEIRLLKKQRDALLEACKMVNNSIFRDRDGEWQLSRPKELLKTICEEAISQANKQ